MQLVESFWTFCIKISPDLQNVERFVVKISSDTTLEIMDHVVLIAEQLCSYNPLLTDTGAVPGMQNC